MTPPTLARGDVVLTRFPFTDLTGASLRPAVVVSQGHIGQDIVLIAISSVVRGALAPTDSTVESTHPEFALTGLRVTSVLRMHKLAAVERFDNHDVKHINLPPEQLPSGARRSLVECYYASID